MRPSDELKSDRLLGNAMATSEPITAMAIIISMIVKARCLVLRRVCTEERIDALRNSCDAGESASKSSCITTVRYLQPFCIITRRAEGRCPICHKERCSLNIGSFGAASRQLRLDANGEIAVLRIPDSRVHPPDNDLEW